MYLGGTENMLTDEGIRQAINFVQRFHYASLQDKNPVISARHNGYAYVIIENLPMLVTAERIKEVTGVDFHTLKQEVLALQNKYEQLVFKLLEKLRARGFPMKDIASGAALEKLLS